MFLHPDSPGSSCPLPRISMETIYIQFFVVLRKFSYSVLELAIKYHKTEEKGSRCQTGQKTTYWESTEKDSSEQPTTCTWKLTTWVKGKGFSCGKDIRGKNSDKAITHSSCTYIEDTGRSTGAECSCKASHNTQTIFSVCGKCWTSRPALLRSIKTIVPPQ